MSYVTPRRLDNDEIDRQLLDLPGVRRAGESSLVLAVRAPSFEEAVQLVNLVAQDAETMDHHPDIDLRWCTVTFTLSTHSSGGLTQLDIELAHQILTSAAAVGAVVVPPAGRIEVAIDVSEAEQVREFWATALGYQQQGKELVDPAGRGPTLWFQPMSPPRQERSRIHLDVYVDLDEALRRMSACLALGGRLVDDSHEPAWWVLADAEGNEVCLCTDAPDPAEKAS